MRTLCITLCTALSHHAPSHPQSAHMHVMTLTKKAPNPHTRQLCHRREPGQGGREPPGWLLQAAHRRVHGGLAHICVYERGRSRPMLTHQHRRQVARRHPQRPWQSPQTARHRARHRARVTRRAHVLSPGREGAGMTATTEKRCPTDHSKKLNLKLRSFCPCRIFRRARWVTV